MFSLLFIAFSVFNVHVIVADQCRDGAISHQDGTAVLKCINDTWVLTGCLTPDGEVPDGTVVKTQTTMMQCQKVGDTMKVVPVGCLMNGRLLAPTQKLSTKTEYFTCNSVNGTLIMEKSGCIGPDNRRIPFDEILVQGSTAFRCNLVKDSGVMVLFGCVYNNRTYIIDEESVDGLYWRTCKKVSDTKATMDKMGCVDGGMKLNPNELFQSHGFLYNCSNDGSNIERIGVGCLEVTPKKTIVEHTIGDTWLEGNEKIKYLVRCSKDHIGVTKSAIKCQFTNNGQETSMEPGCIKKVGKVLYQCAKTANQSLQSATIENPQSDTLQFALASGFKFCD